MIIYFLCGWQSKEPNLVTRDVEKSRISISLIEVFDGTGAVNSRNHRGAEIEAFSGLHR